MSLLLQIQQAAPAVADTINNAVQAVSGVPTTPQPESLSVLEFIFKGGPIMYPIALLSIIAIYIFIERFLVIRRASKIDQNFMNNIRDFMHSGNIESAKSLCKHTDSPIARLIEKGISRIGRPIKEIEDAIENTGKLEVHKLEKNLGILGIIAGIAPMFGFVGTIIGVIKIFYNISLADNISIGLIAGGLYEKMITSASGLIIGIFAYIGYHYLAILTDKVIFKIESNAVEFIDLLQEPAK
ncbi:MAG: MotA/TolQ/ExbB proton channel family protein [Bacteroidota bacterium]